MKVSRIDLQPVGGVAGDMFAAALFDAFDELNVQFQRDLNSLQIPGIEAKVDARLAHGLHALHFHVSDNTTVKPPRTLPEVINFLHQKSLSPQLVACAIDIYTRLAQAEAVVHRKSIDTIHFHEVSDWDSMVDIIAAAGIISRLECSHWRIGPLPLGSGTVNTAHGEIPVPAPATVELLKGFEWTDDGLPGERVTPTGAAILAYLNPGRLSGTAASTELIATGVGCGTRSLPDRANILRALVFSNHNNALSDSVCSIEFDIDDMTGEELAVAADYLRNREGVIDVSSLAIHGKKGRPATQLRLLVKPQQVEQVISECFSVTTTLGVRTSEVQRRLLKRQQRDVDGTRVKVAYRPGGAVTAKAESDDLPITGDLQQRRNKASRTQSDAVDE